MSTCVANIKHSDNPFEFILCINEDTKWYVKENKSASQYILYNTDCPVCVRFNQNTKQITILEVRHKRKVKFNRIASTNDEMYHFEYEPTRFIQKITMHVTQKKPSYLTN